MKIAFDPAKDRANRDKHGLSLAAVASMEFETAVVREDDRGDYGETRWLAAGMIEGRLHMLPSP
ncbi:MAG: BrnT family toxin [Alphaproteobacteria bacterium]